MTTHARGFQWQKGGSRDGRPGYLISFEYDADLVQRLKATVPASLREWRPEEKRWWVSELCQKPLNDLFPGFLEAVIATKPLFTEEQMAQDEKDIEELWPDG